MKYFNTTTILASAFVLSLASCSSDDDSGNSASSGIDFDVPSTYEFMRDGNSTVSYSGQSTRIAMAEEIISAFKNTAKTEAQIDAMFAHAATASDFSDGDLNASSKNVRGKVAYSNDYFSANSTDQATIRAKFDSWISAQVDEVFPNWSTAASAGVAGQIADGTSTRYVSAKGLEYNQAFAKGLIGGLMLDNIANHYLSSAKLDEATNKEDNSAGTVESGESYTTMEHFWDEGFGYLYGGAVDGSVADETVGGDDSFLNKYLSRADDDTDFSGIADDVWDAFKIGRAAIVAKDYTQRDKQAEKIRGLLSKVIGIRAVYYLQQGKNNLPASGTDFGGAFHDLSEGYGFIYSLQFTRKPGTTEPYFTKSEVDGMLVDLMDDGTNGLWDVKATTLDALSEKIAAEFDFTVSQAGS